MCSEFSRTGWQLVFLKNLVKNFYNEKQISFLPRISGQSKIRIPVSGRIFNSTFKYLVKYEIPVIKDIRCIKGYLFIALTTVTASRRHFLENLLIDRYLFNLAGYPAIFSIRYPAGYPSSQSRYPAGYRTSKRPHYLAGYPVHP
jgi:hypothetical protein